MVGNGNRKRNREGQKPATQSRAARFPGGLPAARVPGGAEPQVVSQISVSAQQGEGSGEVGVSFQIHICPAQWGDPDKL